MQVEFIPRQQLRDRLLEGWSLVPDHDYSPADYAIVMLPPKGERVSQHVVNRIEKWFSPKPHRSNKSAGASSRNSARYRVTG